MYQNKKSFIDNLHGTSLVLFLFILILVPIPSFGSVAEVDVIHSRVLYPGGETYPILVRIKISQPWNLHGPQMHGDGLIPTAISFDETEFIRIEKIQFPPTEKKHFYYAQEKLHVYSNEIGVEVYLAIREGAPEGLQEIKGTLSYQACSDTSCLPPEKVDFNLALQVSSKGTFSEEINREIFRAFRDNSPPTESQLSDAGSKGLWLTLLLIFIGGLALNLTPCIYPLIPITVSYFGGRGGVMHGKTIIHALFYISGLAVTNSVLGVISSLTGNMLGTVLQSPYVLAGVAAILISLGLSCMGLWEFKIPVGMTRIASRNFGGYFGTFFMGLTLGIVAAPCLGPFILGLLTYVGQKGDVVLGFACFFVLSLGMGLPLTILAVFSGALEKLPMSGEWMVWIRKAMGWVLIGMAAYFLCPVIPWEMGKVAVISLILVAAGVHLGWLDRSRSPWRGFKTIKNGLGILLLCVGVSYILSPFMAEHKGIEWIPYNDEVLREAAKEGKPVLLDFYADWCVPCVAMERGVFRDDEVLELSRRIVPVRLDLTKKQSYQKEVLEKFGVRGVPTIIFLDREGIEVREWRVESYKDTDKVKERIRLLIKEDNF